MTTGDRPPVLLAATLIAVGALVPGCSDQAADGLSPDAAREGGPAESAGGVEAGAAPQDGGPAIPCRGCWAAIPAAGAPEARSGHTAVWTGDRVVIYGGIGEDVTRGPLQTGGRFLPRDNRWEPMSRGQGLPGRSQHVAVWTGTRVFVWGGVNEEGDTEPGRVGGLYDPVGDSWTMISTTAVPPGRSLTGAVWTGTRVLLWGGSVDEPPGYLGTGASYDPAANAWADMASAGAPSARFHHAAAWTGSSLFVWGGQGSSDAGGSGGIYDPSMNGWRPVATQSAPALEWPVATWTGSNVVVWGESGGRYDPQTDRWSAMATAGAPGPRTQYTATWTGRHLLVWGGRSPSGTALGDGALYDPQADRWTPVPDAGAPGPRMAHVAVWTGEAVFIWGGSGSSGAGNRRADGALFYPPP